MHSEGKGMRKVLRICKEVWGIGRQNWLASLGLPTHTGAPYRYHNLPYPPTGAGALYRYQNLTSPHTYTHRGSTQMHLPSLLMAPARSVLVLPLVCYRNEDQYPG